MEEPVTVTQQFKCDAATLWKAISDQEEMVQWFFDKIPKFRPEVGFRTAFVVENDGRTFPHLWEITEVIIDKKLVYDWRYEGYKGHSIVTFEIESLDGGSQLRVCHINDHPYDQSIPEFRRESCKEGWQYFIQKRLTKYLHKKNLTP